MSNGGFKVKILFKKRLLGLFLAGLGLLSLAACSGDDKQRLLVCPRVGVLYDASKITEFGPGREKDLANLAYEGELSEASIRCKYDGDVVISDIQFAADMWAGPAAPSDVKEFHYFVAITEVNSKVLSKDHFTVKAEFNPKERRIYKVNELKDIRIPISRLGRADLYEILVGWDLTPDQVAYNRNASPFERPNLRRIERP